MKKNVTDWFPLFDAALAHPEPLSALRLLAQGFLAEGMIRADVVDLVEEVRGVLQEQGRDVEEDLLLDLLDQLSGWTGPGLAI